MLILSSGWLLPIIPVSTYNRLPLITRARIRCIVYLEVNDTIHPIKEKQTIGASYFKTGAGLLISGFPGKFIGCFIRFVLRQRRLQKRERARWLKIVLSCLIWFWLSVFVVLRNTCNPISVPIRDAPTKDPNYLPNVWFGPWKREMSREVSTRFHSIKMSSWMSSWVERGTWISFSNWSQLAWYSFQKRNTSGLLMNVQYSWKWKDLCGVTKLIARFFFQSKA